MYIKIIVKQRSMCWSCTLCQKQVAIFSRIKMLGLLFGWSKKRNVDIAPQDVAAAPAPVDHQEEDPDNVPECRKNKEDDFQVENESQEVEGEEKLPIATRTRSSHDCNNKSGASVDNVFPGPKMVWGKIHHHSNIVHGPKKGPVAHVEERTTRGWVIGCAHFIARMFFWERGAY